jgi:hypothetical protein
MDSRTPHFLQTLDPIETGDLVDYLFFKKLIHMDDMSLIMLRIDSLQEISEEEFKKIEADLERSTSKKNWSRRQFNKV